MKRTHIVAAIAAITGILAGCDPKRTETTSSAAASPASDENLYASLAQLPDWSGVWEPEGFGAPTRDSQRTEPKLTPAYAAQYAEFLEQNRINPGVNFVSDVSNCIPPGLPGSMMQPYPIEFLFTPGRVTILIETHAVTRRVYTDGSLMPDDPDPSYQGTSIGHWEGDTLVVETAAILPETSPINGIRGHSEQYRVAERIRLSEPDVLEIRTTLSDPAVFLEPHTFTVRYRRHREWRIMEYVCQQNNRDSVDEQGNPGFNLERKPGA